MFRVIVAKMTTLPYIAWLVWLTIASHRNGRLLMDQELRHARRPPNKGRSRTLFAVTVIDSGCRPLPERELFLAHVAIGFRLGGGQTDPDLVLLLVAVTPCVLAKRNGNKAKTAENVIERTHASHRGGRRGEWPLVGSSLLDPGSLGARQRAHIPF